MAKTIKSFNLPVTSEMTEVADLSEYADTGRASRVGLWALGIGFGGFLLWASFAPLDEGVPAQGTVALDTKRKAVQHLTGGLVKEVLVGEGQRVKVGEPLIRLDDAVARANYESQRQRYFGLRAMEGRLQAELAGEGRILFHPDLLAASSDPMIKQQMLTQEQLLRSRRSSLAATLQSGEESIQGQQALLSSYRSMEGSRVSQLALVNEELKNTRGLVAEGYAPRNKQLELERMTSDSNAAITELQGNTLRAQRAINELRQKSIAVQQDYRKEVEGQLADVNREVQGDEQKFKALQNDLGRTEIRSPAEGQVVGLSVQTVGAVISPGQKLMDIVPDNEGVLVESHVAPNLIDKVHADLPVDVRFSSFANSPSLVVQGKVTTISGDLLQDAPNTPPYYLARVAITPEGKAELGKRVMQPGMPVEVIFKTGERTMMKYLLHPLTKRLAASMKEE
ncbi:MAG: HlyD family type I secretion periplasmic adaptor subunit [Pseudomonadota bacterium]